MLMSRIDDVAETVIVSVVENGELVPDMMKKAEKVLKKGTAGFD